MRDWRPYKATKREVLAFFEEMEVVTIRSLMDRFGYTYKGAQSRIYLLYGEGLIEHLIERGTWGLTTKGGRRLMHFEQTGGVD
jgi:predicted HTH transcriptional regulator